MADYSNSNNSKITISDNTIANPYPSTITVAQDGVISDVTVTLNQVNHTYPDDLDILLVGPQGQTVILMSDTGGTYDLNATNLTFSDKASNSLPDTTAIASGTYKPTNIGTGDIFASPAPSGTYGSTLSLFNGTNAKGDWKLFVVDDETSDIGNIAQGWSLNISTVNSAPVLDGTKVASFTAITEDTTSNPGNSVSSLLGTGFSDVDGNPGGIAVTSLSNTGDGTWQFSTNSGSSWSNFGTVSANNATLLNSSASIRFVPNANYNGSASITYQAWDGTSGTNGTTGVNVTTNGGSTGFSSAPATSNLTITSVNDPPTVTGFDKSVVENKTLTLASSDFTSKYTDVENTPLTSIKITALPTNGVLSLNNTAIAINQEIPIASLSNITYKPNTGFSEENDSFAWIASDGNDYSASAATVNIAVSGHINSAPVLDGTKVASFTAITEDPSSNPGNSVSSLLGTGFSDADGDPGGIAVTSLSNTGDGTWQYSTNSGSNWINFDNVSEKSAILLDSSALIRFVPNANYNGSASITYHAWDGTSDSNGAIGVDVSNTWGSSSCSSATATSSLTITPVNDLPTVESFDKFALADLKVKTGDEFQAKYSDVVEKTPLASIKITTLPTNGVLSLNNTAIAINQEIPRASLSNITYQAKAGFSGNDSFAWKASDGTDYSDSPATVNITVLPFSTLEVNQATDNGLGDTFGSLSWAIKLANDNLGPQTISLKNNVRMRFGDSLPRMKSLIDNDITFNGNGFTISGDNNNNGKVDEKDRPLLFVKSGNVSFNNLTFKGGVANPPKGNAGMGGALFIYDGNVALNSVVFENNQALNVGFGIGGWLQLNNQNDNTGTNGGKKGGQGGAGDFGQIGGLGGTNGTDGKAAGNGGDGGFGQIGGRGGIATTKYGGDGGRGGFGSFGNGGGGGIKSDGNGGDGGFGGGGRASGFGASSANGAALGGAIFVRSGNLNINNSTFKNNLASSSDTGAKGFGGAIFAMTQDAIDQHKTLNASNQGLPEQLPTVTISSNTTFTGNQATDAATKTQGATGNNLNTNAIYGSTNSGGGALPASADSSLETLAAQASNNNVQAASTSTGLDLSKLTLEDFNNYNFSDSIQTTVKTAFGLPSSLDLNNFDPIAAAANGDANATKVVSALVTVQTLVVQIQQTLDGALPEASGVDPQAIALTAVGDLIKQKADAGLTVDLTNSSQVNSILNSAVADVQSQNSGLNLQAITDNQTALVQVMAASTEQIAQAATSGNPEAALIAIYKAQDITINQVAADLQAATAGTISITDVVTQNTGDSLSQQVQAATPAIPPAAVDDSFSLSEKAPLTGNLFSNNGSWADTDLNNSPLTLTQVNGSAANVGNNITLASGAKVTVNADGNFTYEPNSKFDYLSVGKTATDSFTYQIKNGDNLTDSASVALTLTGVNDAPTNISLSNTNIEENRPNGTGVGFLSSTDPDVGDNFTYSLVTGAGSDDNNAFTISGNLLLAKNTLDFESKNSYNIRVKTDDGQGGSFAESFTINVLDLDDFLSISGPTTVLEGVDKVANFSVNLSSPSSSLVTVDYQTTPGSATANSDYTTTSGTITFTPGQTSQTIAVDILDDDVSENLENFNVILTNPTNANLQTAQASALISDTLFSNTTAALAEDIENLTLTGNNPINGIGNSNNNLITGNDNNNR